MIGWENNQGAYFIQKLNEELDSVESDVSDVTTTASNNATNIGKMSDLTTTAKDTLVKAVNEVDSHADANASAIGTLSDLTTSVKTDLVSAVNTVNGGFSNCLRYRGSLNGSDYDLDNFYTLEQAGIYGIGTGVTHAPQDWATLLVLATGDGAAVQFSINATNLRYRMRTGYPLAWTAWRSITTSA